MTGKQAQKKLQELGLSGKIIGDEETVISQLPAGGESVPGNSQIILYCQEASAERKVSVPDFIGMTRQQASDAAGALGLYILVSGNTDITPSVTVTAQSVMQGTQVAVGTTIRLEFADTRAAD